MRKAVLIMLVAAVVPVLAEDKLEMEPWQTDFNTFIALISKMDSNDLPTLKKRLLNRDVQWQGTLKYFRKGRPYIRESFVRVDKETKASRVMFYASPNDLKSWEDLKPGASVTYSGSIEDVKTTTGLTATPFAFVDLREVKLVTEESANTAMDSENK